MDNSISREKCKNTDVPSDSPHYRVYLDVEIFRREGLVAITGEAVNRETGNKDLKLRVLMVNSLSFDKSQRKIVYTSSLLQVS